MLIPSSSPVLFPSDDALEKHLNGRHDQGSHAGGATGLPHVKDDPAKDGRDPKAVKLAIALHQKALQMDRNLSGTMLILASKSGGKLEGLEYRIKSTDSLARKIEGDAKSEKYNGDLEAAAKDISDASRYTMTFEPNSYTQSVDDTIKRLQDMGYEAKAKNFWAKGDDYQGMNVKLTSKNGHIIELQFHTPASLKMKEQKLHKVYEKYREEKDMNKKYTLWNEMVNMSDSIPVPEGYDKLLNIGVPSQHKFNE